MVLMNLMALLIFGVMLMGVVLIPLLYAAGAYDKQKEAVLTEEQEYAVLFDVENRSSLKKGRHRN